MRNNVTEVNDFISHFNESWSTTRCSIMAYGWIDVKQITLSKFLVTCCKGIMFLKSVDASGTVKIADTLFQIFDDVIFVG